MLGATLAGAFAVADLEDYPAPFVKNGVLADSVIVVGKAAETADVLGAVDIAAALQAAAVSQIEIEGTSTAPTVTEGVKVEKSSNNFNYGDMISDIQDTALDDTDLPDLLNDETFDDNEGTNTGEEDYSQSLDFGTTANSVFELVFDQPGDNDVYEDGRPAGSYLYLAEDADVYTYTLLFDSGITVANSADLEGNKLYIQGNTYTVTEASDDGASGADKLVLVAGDSTVWLVQDQPYTIGGHTVTVVDVNNAEDKCGINVDGVTQWVDEGDTQDFGDLSIGILDVIAVNTKDYDADTCELSLGSSEITLEDGEEIVVNEERLDGSEVTFTGTGEWTGFTINYDAGQEDTGFNIDDVYLEAGEAWTDPVFGNWKVLYEGVTADYEEMQFDVKGDDDAELTFMNNDGEEIVVYFHYDGGYELGSDDDKPIVQFGGSTTDGPDDVWLLYSTSGGNEVHMLQVDEVDCANLDITIDDVTYDNDAVADEETFLCSGLNQTVSLGSLGNIILTYDNTTLTFVGGSADLGGGDIETFYEGVWTFNATAGVFTESDGDETIQDPAAFNLVWDSTDGFELANPNGILGGVDNDNDDDSSSWYYTAKGTLVEIDEDGAWVKVMHPEEDVFANVFVAPLEASAVGGVSGGTTADQVNPFSVGLAVLDADAEGMSKNMLVVGGPCANTVAADLMGNPEECTSGFEEGKAMLKYFTRNGKDALLVAGYSAEDTMGASRVLADYEDYDMSGDEVEVVVTSLDQISISTV
jgi:hypothetical protein